MLCRVLGLHPVARIPGDDCGAGSITSSLQGEPNSNRQGLLRQTPQLFQNRHREPAPAAEVALGIPLMDSH